MKDSLQHLFPALLRYPLLREELEKSVKRRNFEKGEILLNEGAYVQVIPLLISGLVKVYKEEEEGQEILLYYIKPGESCIISLTTCLKGNPSAVKAVVAQDSDLLLVPASISRKLGREHPEWNEFFFDLFGNKYQELLHFIGVLSFSNKDLRLKEYLQKEAQLKGQNFLDLTHQRIADDLGSSREVISRLLKRLEGEGFIRLGHGRIEIL